MNLVVFTTVIGGHTDPLRTVQHRNPDVRYLCFTDRLILDSNRGWELVLVRVPEGVDPAFFSRRLKILAHETLIDYDPDVSLWVDAAFELYCDPVDVAQRWLWRADMIAMKHPDRQTIVQEGETLVRLGIVPKATIEQQLLRARVEGFEYSAQRAITSTGFCMRRHSRRVLDFNKAWWKLFAAAGHHRDQMSVDWALWKVGLDMRYLDGHYRDNPYARWYRTPPARFNPDSKPLVTS
jgi:hypothetical protein